VPTWASRFDGSGGTCGTADQGLLDARLRPGKLAAMTNAGPNGPWAAERIGHSPHGPPVAFCLPSATRGQGQQQPPPGVTCRGREPGSSADLVRHGDDRAVARAGGWPPPRPSTPLSGPPSHVAHGYARNRRRSGLGPRSRRADRRAGEILGRALVCANHSCCFDCPRPGNRSTNGARQAGASKGAAYQVVAFAILPSRSSTSATICHVSPFG
jgi:hypothetical protein